MENMMASFSSKEFGQIRVIQENGKCLFCGLDVAKALGYKNNRKALTDHCRDSLQNARKKTGSDPKGVALPAFLL